MTHRIADELHGIDLPDERLSRRAQTLLETLAAQPEASINAACDTWSETQAAYRFCDNPNVTPEAIHQPHYQATLRRIRQQPVILDVQDTTELDYTKHPPKDVRCLASEHSRGLYAHLRFAVTPNKQNLGLLGIEYFDRAAETLGQRAKRRHLPIEEKESLRWLDGYRGACQLAAECPEAQVVSVADREADIYDIFVEAQSVEGPRAKFLIRAKQVRRTTQPDPQAGPDAYRTVLAEVAASEVRERKTLELPTTPKRKARTATLEIRAKTVTVLPPLARSHLPQVTLNVVLVREVGGPNDGTDVEWLLLTSLPIATVPELQLIVQYYVARWAAEIFFRVWKTGCRVEDIQLETVSRLKKVLLLYAIIAWRITYVTYESRERPGASCETVFSVWEWQMVWRVVLGGALPSSPPRLEEFLRLLAQLGGYNNRKGDGPPGPQSIWWGLRRLSDFLIAEKALADRPEKDVCK